MLGLMNLNDKSVKIAGKTYSKGNILLTYLFLRIALSISV